MDFEGIVQVEVDCVSIDRGGRNGCNVPVGYMSPPTIARICHHVSTFSPASLVAILRMLPLIVPMKVRLCSPRRPSMKSVPQVSSRATPRFLSTTYLQSHSFDCPV